MFGACFLSRSIRVTGTMRSCAVVEGEIVNVLTDRSLIGTRVRVTREITPIRETRQSLSVQGMFVWTGVLTDFSREARQSQGYGLVFGIEVRYDKGWSWFALGDWEDCNCRWVTDVEVLGS